MDERSFIGITTRFLYAFCWCFALGLIIGALYYLPFSHLQNTLKSIVTENSAPKSFHLISTASVFSLGFLVVFFGRTGNEISRFRYIVGYRGAEVALSLAAVFYGLLFGFSLAVFEWPLFAAGIFTFLVTAGFLILLLWLSFSKNGTDNELNARLSSAVLIGITFCVAWYEYFR